MKLSESQPLIEVPLTTCLWGYCKEVSVADGPMNTDRTCQVGGGLIWVVKVSLSVQTAHACLGCQMETWLEEGEKICSMRASPKPVVLSLEKSGVSDHGNVPVLEAGSTAACPSVVTSSTVCDFGTSLNYWGVWWRALGNCWFLGRVEGNLLMVVMFRELYLIKGPAGTSAITRSG